MIRICTLILISTLGAPPLLADVGPAGSMSIDLFEYRFRGDIALLDAEAEYGTSANRAVLKFVTLSAPEETETAAALLYRRGITERIDLQAGIEFTGEKRHFILGLQADSTNGIATELVALVDNEDDGYVIGKIEHDWPLSDRLSLWPRCEVFAALQRDAETGAAAGPSLAVTDLRLRFKLDERLTPYVGVSWELALGDSADQLEAAGLDRSITTIVAGASFAF